MKKVAVVLSGCGAMDGAEIREAICLLLSFSQLEIKYDCFSIDKPQRFVYDHYNNKISEGETRNTLIESARIARDKIRDVSLLKVDEFDGLAFVGGYGNVMNFTTVDSQDFTKDFTVDPTIEQAIKAFIAKKKPLYFLCVSPVLLTKIISHIKITLGGKNEISEKLKKKGIDLVEKTTNSPTIDEINKLITVPCYMLNVSLAELYAGIYDGAKEFKNLL